jgi:predicted dithiol-disulfide oxidoreductase (DUF899 family)
VVLQGGAARGVPKATRGDGAGHGRGAVAPRSRSPRAQHTTSIKPRHDWELIPWYTITDDFDKDFDVDEWHGTHAFFRHDGRIYRNYFHR